METFVVFGFLHQESYNDQHETEEGDFGGDSWITLVRITNGALDVGDAALAVQTA